MTQPGLSILSRMNNCLLIVSVVSFLATFGAKGSKNNTVDQTFCLSAYVIGHILIHYV